MTRSGISRRRAMGLIVGTVTVAVAAGTAGWVAGLGGSDRSKRVRLGPAGPPLAQPAVLSSRDGVLDVQLAAAPGVRLAGADTSALGYNGTSPGPTLHLQPGDLLRVRLVNHLTTPTNLHTHGLHVSPLGRGDNPFRIVVPGASFDYAYRIPVDHPQGTYWYHPHLHGHAADQVFGGLVGALLIGDTPEVPVAADRILLVTDTTLDDSGRVAEVDMMARMRGREGQLVLVNGQHEPVIAGVTGSLERWRIVNACTSRVLSLRLIEDRLTQVALDGVLFPAPVDSSHIVLMPGNRADVVVQPTDAGRYQLVTLPYRRSMTENGAAAGPCILVTFTVTGPAATAPPLPANLPAPTVAQAPVTVHRKITMGAYESPGTYVMTFTIDGRSFNPARNDQIVALGSTEEWTVVNPSPMDHPFHLHIWRFQVVDGSGGIPLTGLFQDVVLVPAGGWARLRIPFTDYPGRGVYHSHVLDHADLGMMATVAVRG